MAAAQPGVDDDTVVDVVDVVVAVASAIEIHNHSLHIMRFALAVVVVVVEERSTADCTPELEVPECEIVDDAERRRRRPNRPYNPVELVGEVVDLVVMVVAEGCRWVEERRDFYSFF